MRNYPLAWKKISFGPDNDEALFKCNEEYPAVTEKYKLDCQVDYNKRMNQRRYEIAKDLLTNFATHTDFEEYFKSYLEVSVQYADRLLDRLEKE